MKMLGGVYYEVYALSLNCVFVMVFVFRVHTQVVSSRSLSTLIHHGQSEKLSEASASQSAHLVCCPWLQRKQPGHW
jgi:hypothetical protein